MGLGNWLVQKLANLLLTEISPPRGFLCDYDRICHEVRPCDVLLVEGRNRISKIIQHTTQSPWSHSALYIGKIHDVEDPKLREFIQRHYKGPISEQLLIEAEVGQGTIIVPISKYKLEHVRICRPAGLSHHDAQQVIATAAGSIGQNYDVRHFFDLGRFMLYSRLIPRRWNSKVFQKKTGKAHEDICSTMIARAFISVKFPILPLIRKTKDKKFEVIRRNPNLFAPCDFDYSPYFEIIKYPMIPVAGYSAYRHLPWEDNWLSNDDEGLIEATEQQET